MAQIQKTRERTMTADDCKERNEVNIWELITCKVKVHS